MTSEQLQATRAERWRQIANPLLTADDARAWLDAAGLCLFLPRRQQLLAPAPSFVEACSGAPAEAPSREAIDNAGDLMRRLVSEAAIIPLNLFGTPSETPDFLATTEAFPYIFSLRGTRDWKTEPGGKTSPLVLGIWNLLEKEGTLTAVEIQSTLGRELTEAAALRGLMELWSNLRVMPEFAGDTPTRWSLTQLRFKDQLNAGGKMSQTTALSALVSLYLESVVAASSEDIETFLSPLTSRSRVRETVNGLAATRQLSMVSVGAQPMFHIAGTLPEFAEPEAAEKAPAEGAADDSKPAFRPRQADRAPRTFERKPFERKPYERKTGERTTGERKTSDRPAARGPRKPDGERKPWQRKSEGDGKSFGRSTGFGKKPFDKTARPRDAASRDARPSDGERPARTERGLGTSRGLSRGPGSDRAPRTGRTSGTGRPSFRAGAGAGGAGRSSGGKFPPKKFGGKPAGGKFGGREDRPWTPRPAGDGERRPVEDFELPTRPRREDSDDRPSSFRPREAGASRPSSGFAGKSKFAGSKKFDGPRKFDGPGRPKSGAAKFGGSKPAGRTFGGARSDRPRTDRPSSDRPRTDRPRSGGAGTDRPGTDRPRTDRPRTDRPRTDRPKFGGSKFGAGAKGRDAEGGKRPFFRKRPEEGSGGESRPRSSARPSFGSSRPSAGRPQAGGARSGGAWKDKPAGARSFKPAGDASERPRSPRSAFGKSKPAGGGSFGAGKKFGGRPAAGGKSFGGAKKFGAPKKFGAAKKFGGFGARKPGGAKPPFRKRKDEGSKSAE
ncbi:hypothetical protein HNQ77_003892 [Silvibacterium bohemicum]|uniref:Uncharacterized protein n=1 Tax=Silvibacterium bohemicum TaxID=1577686 RepID=A0A841JX31_9BACT|nr:hypothetical protein [Silvibacterium bohemicum]MBB6145922.1 hypothetical protein [Silvibacterium bohemicum]